MKPPLSKDNSRYDGDILYDGTFLASCGDTMIYMGVQRNGVYVITASNEIKPIYYPKYCPECGRSLCNNNPKA